MAAPDPPHHEAKIAREIARKAERKLKARDARDRGVWFGLGMFGLVGWSIAAPTLLGIGLGLWLDAHVAGRVSWTLTLLFAGLALGCLNAWFWVNRESRHE